jgi:CHAT domain-containing protein/predicted negative regulator of RcsB-dependent stress response
VNLFKLTNSAIRLAVASSLLALILSWSGNTSLATAHSINKGQDAALQNVKQGDRRESEIQAGAVESYQLSLDGQEYFQITVEQRNVNVALTLVGTDGTKLAAVNQQRFRQGIERLYWIADSPGNYQIQIRSLEKKEPGTYQIRIEEVRRATNTDELRVGALQTYWKALQLGMESDDASRSKAIEKHQQALKLFNDAGDQWGQGTTLHRIGLVYWDLKQWQKAIEYFKQAIPFYRAAGDRQGEAGALADQGGVYGDDQNADLDVSKAASLFDAALPIAREIGDKELESRILYNEARLYNRPTGDWHKAIGLYELSLEPRRAIGDLKVVAFTLNNMGMAYFNSGEPYQALKNLNEALAAIKIVGSSTNEAGYLCNIAMAHYSVGEVQKALDTLDQALAIIRADKIEFIEPYAFGLQGQILSSLGEHERAIESYEKALGRIRQFGMSEGERAVLSNMADTYSQAGQYDKAIETYGMALRVKVPGDPRETDPGRLMRLADVYLASGNARKALELMDQAIPLLRENEKRDKATALEILGRVYLRLNEPGKAMAALTSAFDETLKLGESADLTRLTLDLARANKLLGNLDEARTQSDACLARIEASRSRLINPELRTSYFATQQEAYYFQVDLLMDLASKNPGKGFEALALEASETRRARSLLEGLTASRTDLRKGVDSQLLAQDNLLGQRLNAKQEFRLRLLSGPHRDEQVAENDKEIAALVVEYQAAQDLIKKASPAYSALIRPQTLTVNEIQGLLTPDTLLLEYSLGSERSFLWAVTTDSVNTYNLAPRSEIETATKRMYGLLTARQPQHGESQTQYLARVKEADTQYEREVAALSQMLLGPVADRLGKKRLVIVTDGSLGYLPFAALPTPGTGKVERTLVTDHEIVYLPSASTLPVLRRDVASRASATKTLAVLADPVFDQGDSRVSKGSNAPVKDNQPVLSAGLGKRALRDAGLLEEGVPLARLPFSRQEAETIAALTPAGESFKALGFSANLSTAISPEISRYRIVHFATHALVNPTHPYLSGLLLSLVDEQGRPQDGFLSLNQIYNLNLPAELVVLSACQTATGKEVKGEGIIGLTRAFMYAGAPRVVASLWKVDDAATAEIIKRFYRAMLQKGLRPAAALQVAQMEMSQSKLWSSPYYWAGFVLQGDPN